MRRFIGFMIFMLCFACAWGKSYRVRIKFYPSSPRVGGNRAIVLVNDSSGNPVSRLNLYLRTAMPGMEMPATSGILPWPGKEISPGRYAIPFRISMYGLWQLDLLSRESGGLAEKIFSLQRTVGPESHPIRNIVFITLGLIFLLLLFFLFPRRLFTLRAATAFMVFLLLAGLGFVYTTTLKRSEYPGQEAYDGMGMKMNMDASDMGMSNRILSAPTPVDAEIVRRGPIAQTATYSGIVAPDLEETVYPRVTGWLLSMPFYPGMKVRDGEALGRLDTTQLQANTEAAREKFAADQQEAGESRLRLLAMESKVKEAKASLDYWKGEIKREAYLARQGAVSLREYDGEKNHYLEALARYHAALYDHHASIKSVASAEAVSRSDYASFRAAATIQSYASLTSLINGVVTKRLVNEGVLVHPGMPILKVSDIRFVRLQADVAESDLSKIHMGTPVLVQSPKLGSRTLKASVTSIFYDTNPETHTGKVEARVLNSGDLFFPGDFVTLTFVLQRKANALTVASSAVLAYHETPSVPNVLKPTRYFVWMAGKDGLAHRRFVVPGVSNGERTEIAGGLAAGDEVITNGMQGLQEMDPVAPVVAGKVLHPSLPMPGMRMPARKGSQP